MIRDVYSGSWSWFCYPYRIADPGVKKAPDTGSATLFVSYVCWTSINASLVLVAILCVNLSSTVAWCVYWYRVMYRVCECFCGCCVYLPLGLLRSRWIHMDFYSKFLKWQRRQVIIPCRTNKKIGIFQLTAIITSPLCYLPDPPSRGLPARLRPQPSLSPPLFGISPFTSHPSPLSLDGVKVKLKKSGW